MSIFINPTIKMYLKILSSEIGFKWFCYHPRNAMVYHVDKLGKYITNYINNT